MGPCEYYRCPEQRYPLPQRRPGCRLRVVCSTLSGAWCLVHGWCMVYGAWCLVNAALHAACCMQRCMVSVAWCLLHGVCCMQDCMRTTEMQHNSLEPGGSGLGRDGRNGRCNEIRFVRTCICNMQGAACNGQHATWRWGDTHRATLCNMRRTTRDKARCIVAACNKGLRGWGKGGGARLGSSSWAAIGK